MRIQMNDSRERTYSALVDATGQNAKSKALDDAARYYLRMRGDNAANPHGAISELLAAAEERGSLTGSEIADILDAPELSVNYDTQYSVGREQ